MYAMLLHLRDEDEGVEERPRRREIIIESQTEGLDPFWHSEY